MGRLAHVTSLALGRSPFGPPLRDENGDFILGPHAYDNDGPGYRQQFDDRGHPENLESKAAARRLRKAQNDVLATVGVVVKKGEERKSYWEKLEDHQKHRIIHEENQKGAYLKGEDRLLGIISSWPVVSLRSRLTTFSHYNTMSVTSLVSKEVPLLGIFGWTFAGMPLQLISHLPQLFRYYIREPNIEGMVNFINPERDGECDDTWAISLRWYSAVTIMRCFEIPLLVHAALQSLHIIPFNAGLNWKSIVPFQDLSPICFPVLPGVITMDSMIQYTFDFVRTPFALYFIREFFQAEIGYRSYGLFRQILVKPDKPDAISARVSDDTETIDDTSIAGIGYPRDDPNSFLWIKRYFGPRSFFGALRLAFPPLYAVLNFIGKGRLARSRGRLTPLLDRQLRAAVRHRYWHDRGQITTVPRRGSPEDMEFRRAIVGHVFDYANLDPVEELVDVEAWTHDTLGPKADILRVQTSAQPTSSRASSASPPHERATEEPPPSSPRVNELVSNILDQAFEALPASDAVLIHTYEGPVMMFNQQTHIDPENVAEMENILTIDATQVPRSALLQGVEYLQGSADEAGQPQNQHPDTAVQQTNTQEQQPQQHQTQEPAPSISADAVPESQTPTPGIRRALSLTDPHFRPPSQPQSPNTLRTELPRLRRPTETDDSLAAISETLRAEAEALQSPRPPTASLADEDINTTYRWNEDTQQPERIHETIEQVLPPPPPDPPLLPQRYRPYRVTMLSNFAADSLAWHASAILTSLILWPIETVWLRCIADWALHSPAMGAYIDPWWSARLGFGVIGRPLSVMSPETRFAGAMDRSGRFRYVGGVLLTLGVEGVLRGVCWNYGVWCVGRWREKFGWGQF